MNRDPRQKKVYCTHGTFPDHCGACTGEYMDRLELVAEAAREALDTICMPSVGDYHYHQADDDAMKALSTALAAIEGEI